MRLRSFFLLPLPVFARQGSGPEPGEYKFGSSASLASFASVDSCGCGEEGNANGNLCLPTKLRPHFPFLTSASHTESGATPPKRDFLSYHGGARMNNDPSGVGTGSFFWITLHSRHAMLFKPCMLWGTLQKLWFISTSGMLLVLPRFREGLGHWKNLWKSPAPLFCLPHWLIGIYKWYCAFKRCHLPFKGLSSITSKTGFWTL